MSFEVGGSCLAAVSLKGFWLAAHEVLLALRLYNAGLIRSPEVMGRVDEDWAQTYGSGHMYRDFAPWVAENCKEADRLCVRQRRPRGTLTATSVTPDIVRQQLSEIQEMLVSAGIAEGVPPRIVKPSLVWCCDEKGYSARCLGASSRRHEGAGPLGDICCQRPGL